ncbi:MAG: winged helix-turn-helix domain-containing protein [Solirubrobacteraceae bacterium]
MSSWTFLTNHARVLVCVGREPQIRLREIAQCAKITERTAQAILNDLVDAGYVTRRRTGRRNLYEIHLERPLRHELDSEHAVHEVLSRLVEDRVQTEDAA